MKELLIKNMVCPRCIQAVQQIFKQVGIPYQTVDLGRVILDSPLSPSLLQEIERETRKLGFEVLHKQEAQKIERVKTVLRQLFVEGDMPPAFVLSNYIQQQIPGDYPGLSYLFSTTEGVTIEKYFIQLKVEKIKEYLFYQEMNISEIALRLGYSSVQHLSTQFKKETGMTPTSYKNLQVKSRKSLDSL